MEIKNEEYQEYLKEEYLSVHEATELLGVSEEELWGLIKKHAVPTHNMAGVFTRLKKSEIEEIKNKLRIERELFPKPEKYFSHHATVRKATPAEKIADFWYFNDFYILCTALIAVLVYFILTSQ